MTVPNLDAMPQEELEAFWLKHMRGRKIKDLFPDKPIGAQRATKDLAHYAQQKGIAVQQRLAGHTNLAQQYETICERIYKNLAPWARW